MPSSLEDILRALPPGVEPGALECHAVDAGIDDRTKGAGLNLRLVVRAEQFDRREAPVRGPVSKQKAVDGRALVQRQGLQEGATVNASRPPVFGGGLVVGVVLAPEIRERGASGPNILIVGGVSAAGGEVDRLNRLSVVGQDLAGRLARRPACRLGDDVRAAVHLRRGAVDVVVVAVVVLRGKQCVRTGHDRHGAGPRLVVKPVLGGHDACHVILERHAVHKLEAGVALRGPEPEVSGVGAGRLGGQGEGPGMLARRGEMKRPRVQPRISPPGVNVALAAAQRDGFAGLKLKDRCSAAGKEHRKGAPFRRETDGLDIGLVVETHLDPVGAVGRRLRDRLRGRTQSRKQQPEKECPEGKQADVRPEDPVKFGPMHLQCEGSG